MSGDDIWAVSWSSDQNGLWNDVDLLWTELTGQSSEGALNDGWLALVHEADRLNVKAALDRARVTQRAFRVSVRIGVINEQQYCPAVIVGTPCRDRDGTFRGHRGTICDNSGAAQETSELLEKVRRLQATIDAAPIGLVYSNDVECRSVTSNRALLEQFDFALGDNPSASSTAPDAPGRRVRYVKDGTELHAEELPLQVAARERRLVGPTEIEVVLPSGRQWLMLAFAAPVFAKEGSLLGSVLATVDITEQKKAEQASKRDQALLQAVLDGTQDSIFLKDRECRLLLANRAVFASLNRTAEQCIGKTDEEFFDDPAEGRACMANDLRIMATGVAESVVESMQTPQGIVYHMCNKVPFRDEHGAIVGIIGTARNITEQKKAERALRVSELCYRTLVDATSAITWRRSNLGLAVEPQPEWIAFTGQTEDVAARLGWADAIHPDDRAAALEQWQHALEHGTTYSTTYRLRRWDGAWRWMSVRGVPIRDCQGMIVEWFGMNIDFTELKEADEALRISREALAKSQRLEAIGKLAGGIAHDFNNLLTVISGNLSLAQVRVTEAKASYLIGKAVEAIKLGSDLTRLLLSFAGRRMLAPKIVDINHHVIDVTQMLRQSLGEPIVIETDLSDGIWKTCVEEGDIDSAIVNIALNARDAMPDGGRLLISTSNVNLSHMQALELSVPPGQYACLRMTDTGHGMNADVLSRATDPFFTTKEISKGSGLGLSSVYGFARRAGGSLAISSEVERGTCVSIYLPRAIGESEVRAVQLDEAPQSASGELVLVVDDNDLVREVTEARFDALGYRVVTAKNGAEAVQVLQDHNDIKLVFSDVIMPGGMTGYEVAHWTRQHRPDIKVLLSSGYIDPNSEQDRDDQLTVLGKPYTQDELARSARDVLLGRQ